MPSDRLYEIVNWLICQLLSRVKKNLTVISIHILLNHFLETTVQIYNFLYKGLTFSLEKKEGRKDGREKERKKEREESRVKNVTLN